MGAGLNPIVIWLRLLSIRVGVTLSLFSVCPLVPEEGLRLAVALDARPASLPRTLPVSVAKTRMRTHGVVVDAPRLDDAARFGQVTRTHARSGTRRGACR